MNRDVSGNRQYTRATIQMWAANWAKRIGIDGPLNVIVDETEFVQRNGADPRRPIEQVLGAQVPKSATGDIYIRPNAAHVLDTVIHELLHRKHRNWPEWKVLWTASELAAGRSGKIASQAKTLAEFVDRAADRLLRRAARKSCANKPSPPKDGEEGKA